MISTFRACSLFSMGLATLLSSARAADLPANIVQGVRLRFEINAATGELQGLTSSLDGPERAWLAGAARFTVRNEVNNIEASPQPAAARQEGGDTVLERRLPELNLTLKERWHPLASGLTWDLEFSGDTPRAGHEVVIELPVLGGGDKVFTPTDRGILDLDDYPTFRPAAYGSWDWDGGSYVLPLISVFNMGADRALTVALPADAAVPHLQVEWRDRSVLVLRLGHRGMGGAQPSSLRILFYAHAADYRSVLKAYSDDFPAYFHSTLPRGEYEGAFWYHHIQAHPDYDEMARQNVRFIWSSFWFTHLGDYMPDEKEWHPYTYAAGWKLGETMSDARINAFIDDMHAHHIGTYAYFNLTEYGGKGGQSGDPAEANRLLREKFANALLKNAAGRPIPTWEGAMAMNPRKKYTLWPALEEQIKRHIQRIPKFDGFVIDRLDWAGAHGKETDGYDYAHDDGLTMVADKPAESMAGSIAEALQALCGITHAAGKRVFVNQFYRIELLRDVDGYCHEDDYLPAMSYLAPFRPASAWSEGERPYQQDLLAFEAQLKRRLQCALFPQMIAHQFPISQQRPNPRAADLQEIYAPLFETLIGKEQVLVPHCVAVSGANDANLYVNGAHHYVVPVTSRWRFLTRQNAVAEPVTVRLRVSDSRELRWAQVWSADGRPARAAVQIGDDGVAQVSLRAHATASVIVAGPGAEPALDAASADGLADLRRRVFPASSPSVDPAERPAMKGIVAGHVSIVGTQVGFPGPVSVFADGRKLGSMSGAAQSFELTPIKDALPGSPPSVRLEAGCEGTWLVPERIQLVVKKADGVCYRVAQWCSADSPTDEAGGAKLAWCHPERVAPNQ